jgi:acyl-coenzyme A synthetase/AMP-(fatty) acid ligase
VGDNLVVDAATGRTTRWRDLATIDLPGPSAVLVDRSVDAMPYVARHLATNGELLIASANRVTPDDEDELLAAGLTVLTGDASRPARPRDPDLGRIWLLTSGSTGRPKRVAHTIDSLSTVRGDLPPRRWLCPYSPGSYAWWQLVTLGVGHPGQDLVVVDPADLGGWVAAAAAYDVTAVSGTPTFWRQALLSSRRELTTLPLEQVTLGGEPVDQAILDQLREVFPDARISWIYASSELGASIVVHDGQAGFPLSWLGSRVPGRPEISVEDDELVLASPYHAEGLTGPVRTGDRVLVVDDRVHIVGRVDFDEINVGGAKVSAGHVRHVLQGHPDVRWARVSGRRAPMVGSVVVAEVVLADTAAADAETLLSTWCREHLAPAAVPRRWRVLDQIPVKETLKTDV